jgi:hypothetical protein
VLSFVKVMFPKSHGVCADEFGDAVPSFPFESMH